jgi:hypothetical protein
MFASINLFINNPESVNGQIKFGHPCKVKALLKESHEFNLCPIHKGNAIARGVGCITTFFDVKYYLCI